jgi:hypothetical protein
VWSVDSTVAAEFHRRAAQRHGESRARRALAHGVWRPATGCVVRVIRRLRGPQYVSEHARGSRQFATPIRPAAAFPSFSTTRMATAGVVPGRVGGSCSTPAGEPSAGRSTKVRSYGKGDHAARRRGRSGSLPVRSLVTASAIERCNTRWLSDAISAVRGGLGSLHERSRNSRISIVGAPREYSRRRLANRSLMPNVVRPRRACSCRPWHKSAPMAG